MRNEFVELGFSDKVLKVEQEVEALLIRDAGECIIGVLALKVSDQLGEFMVVTKVFDRVGESLPSDNGREMTIRLAVTTEVSITWGDSSSLCIRT